jgi:peptidoglycan/xylan/chitin deacetylase (PgdA/CDA1 family)
VVLRYDDYSALSPTDLERRIVATLADHRLTSTFGVIPYRCAGDAHDARPQRTVPLTRKKAALLRAAIGAGTVEVALHGWSHQTGAEYGAYTEFAGLPPAEQRRRIEEGRDLLRTMLGTKVRTFIPPWNSYDAHTLTIAANLGMKVFSAGLVGPAPGETGLSAVPATCGLATLRDSVAAARHARRSSPVVVVLFHRFDFVEIDRKRGVVSWEKFKALI